MEEDGSRSAAAIANRPCGGAKYWKPGVATWGTAITSALLSTANSVPLKRLVETVNASPVRTTLSLLTAIFGKSGNVPFVIVAPKTFQAPFGSLVCEAATRHWPSVTRKMPCTTYSKVTTEANQRWLPG